ncbi:hypothetical protein GF339_22210 [candidate division KSB3 bacterium]|uniref:Uncharacterized protein n=1 Tax=candidate division KSB3 bacterium TaxID=2044937 RepID=A0A9D5Q8X9_9BACT|nr:hypothetical protein [candidate division KSB3 bacterium]MBD3327316.1 hypothetical protein [candidate division KSB3 bacterium]
MDSQSQHENPQPEESSNPLDDIAENIGVTPKVLTQLATGDDKEFRELVKGIFNMLPEEEVVLVAKDQDINPDFLDYLSHVFETNQNVLLAILHNPSSHAQTKQYILNQLSQDIRTSLLNNPDTPSEVLTLLKEQPSSPKKPSTATSQAEEFKIKMKVSKLLNDLEANLGLTVDAFLKIRAQNSEQSQEFVREVYKALPERDVLLVSRDPDTSPKILNYLSRLFDTNYQVLATILSNPSTDEQTILAILKQLPAKVTLSLAKNSQSSPALLHVLKTYCTSSAEIKAALQANPAMNPTPPKNAQEAGQTDAEPVNAAPEISEGSASIGDDVEAKIALCVDKLYDINANIVTEFIKKAQSEILKKLALIERANHLILKTILKHPSLTIQDLDTINIEMFMTLLKKAPDTIDEELVMKLIQRSRK